jgi:hypothetical protein
VFAAGSAAPTCNPAFENNVASWLGLLRFSCGGEVAEVTEVEGFPGAAPGVGVCVMNAADAVTPAAIKTPIIKTFCFFLFGIV